MDGSILEDVRIACNLERNDNSFDDQLILLTNSFLFRSVQLGVGKKGFSIDGIFQVWSDFVEEGYEALGELKIYIGLQVRMVFDPPENSALKASMDELIDKLEWCIYTEADLKA